MPDWTYQTVFRPALRLLPFTMAQAIAFRAMGLLGRNTVGRSIIDCFGHAKPSADVAIDKNGVQYPSPCVLGCGVDIPSHAVSAVSLFGFGMIEVGPVSPKNAEVAGNAALTNWHDHGLKIAQTTAASSAAELTAVLEQNSVRQGVPVIARLLTEGIDSSELQSLKETLNPVVDGYSLRPSVTNTGEPDIARLLQQTNSLQESDRLLYVVIDASMVDNEVVRQQIPQLTVSGFILEGGLYDDGHRGALGDAIVRNTVENVRRWRTLLPAQTLIASGGVQQPADALQLLDAGADLVMVDSGFAAAGPGLPKRINTAVQSRKHATGSSKETDCVPIPHRSWFWAFLLGIGLFGGGLIALVVGWTRVLLPYDEEFLGMLREEVCSINAKLLPFMSHDRVTLAGTMLALGPLYLALAWFGDRKGMHWARVSVVTGAFVGFFSFFLFLGFGYFDPFHAFISAVMFQLTTLCLRSSQANCEIVEFELCNSASWKRALWGQLLMVVQGTAILTGGIVISSFGVTSVFVPEDLAFMQTTRAALVEGNDRLVPLVAHDRASFGGMLMSTGVTVLLTALWGWQRGRRWLWAALAVAGTVAYTTTIAIHWTVGYTSLIHLLPAYGGLMALWVALLLSREWMFEDATVYPQQLDSCGKYSRS